ncbi:MAG TPA: aminomethyl-transferring glycine dehydrogenase subunit GcvPA [Deltaproteobacteria bacterium]|nr:aminomethyl-transferring glycine dehydrogenase subunit GcvPA [Deltaproteobacteria bacterium]
MRYLPHTEEDIKEMLQTVGSESLDALFSMIPENCRRSEDMNLPESLTEWELDKLMENLSNDIAASPEYKSFVGAGSYEHYIPASAQYLLSRSEFVTSYTPYQPEMTQGTLQAIYEYQTLVSRLLGMEVANASIYDGASALAEALLMSIRITRKNKVAVSQLVHPLYRQVIKTYFKPSGYEIVELPYLESGLTDISGLKDLEDFAAVAVQSPNFFGCIEDLHTVGEMAHEKKTLLVAAFTEPLAFGLFKSPGSLGADIACGEGQSLGIPQAFGGPALGLFAGKLKYVRHMPGRLVGETVDRGGKRGYVLTLATREQHIRREKATSNICTNNSLCALASAMYMASTGGTGIRSLARLNYDKSEYLKSAFRNAGIGIPFEGATFNEFVVKLSGGSRKAYDRLLKKKIIAGLDLAPYYSELENHYLFCVTETKSRAEMDRLVQEMTS